MAPLGSQDVVQEPTGLVQEIMELKEPFQAFLGGSMCANHQFLQQDLRFWNSMTLITFVTFVVPGVLLRPHFHTRRGSG